MLRKLRCFIATAEYGSFTKAGEALFMSQSAVSQQVSSLEKHLGVKLFERTDSGVCLTHAGSVLFHKGQPLVNELEELFAHVAAIETTGAYSLQILYDGTRQDPLIVPLIRSLAVSHPDISIRLDPFTGKNDRLAMLKDGRVDVMTGRRFPPTRGSELGFAPLCITQLLAVVPEGHPFCSRELVRYDDLMQEPLILMDDVFSFTSSAPRKTRGIMRHQHIHNEIRIRHEQPELITMVPDTKSALTLCKAGMGITLIDSGWIPDTGGVTCVSFEEPDEQELGLCYSESNGNPALAAFVDLACETYADKPLFGPDGKLTPTEA